MRAEAQLEEDGDCTPNEGEGASVSNSPYKRKTSLAPLFFNKMNKSTVGKLMDKIYDKAKLFIKVEENKDDDDSFEIDEVDEDEEQSSKNRSSRGSKISKLSGSSNRGTHAGMSPTIRLTNKDNSSFVETNSVFSDRNNSFLTSNRGDENPNASVIEPPPTDTSRTFLNPPARVALQRSKTKRDSFMKVSIPHQRRASNVSTSQIMRLAMMGNMQDSSSASSMMTSEDSSQRTFKGKGGLSRKKTI